MKLLDVAKMTSAVRSVFRTSMRLFKWHGRLQPRPCLLSLATVEESKSDYRVIGKKRRTDIPQMAGRSSHPEWRDIYPNRLAGTIVLNWVVCFLSLQFGHLAFPAENPGRLIVSAWFSGIAIFGAICLCNG